MNSQSRWIQKAMVTGLIASTMILGIGCASKKGDDPAPPPAAVAPTTPDREAAITNRGPEFTEGATAVLALDSLQALASYIGNAHPLNNPTDVRISVKLHEISPGANQYAGRVMVSYQDNGQYYTGRFLTGDGKNPTGSLATSGTYYPGWNHAFYNNWFSWNGKAAFHGFYEDQYGAIMLIADEVVNLNDGAGATEVSGSIWFKNFAVSQYPRANPSLPCWYTTTANFDCRTLLVSGMDGFGNMKSDSALYPTQSQFFTDNRHNPYIPEEPARGWRRLGTYGGLNKPKAFSN